MQSRVDVAGPRAQKSKESTTLQFTECTNPDIQQAKKTLSLQAVWEGSCFQASYISKRNNLVCLLGLALLSRDSHTAWLSSLSLFLYSP